MEMGMEMAMEMEMRVANASCEWDCCHCACQARWLLNGSDNIDNKDKASHAPKPLALPYPALHAVMQFHSKSQ